MFSKTFFSQLFFQVVLQLLLFLFKKAKFCMYKPGDFPNMPKNSKFNTVIKVRRNLSNVSAKELINFLKMEFFLSKTINMQSEILDRSKI